MDRPVTKLLTHSALRVPDKCAFADAQTSLTFSEMNRLSDGIAMRLIKEGYHKEGVYLLMKKSPAFVAAMTGVTKAGCFYVPAEDVLPDARILHELSATKVRVLICDETTYGRASEYPGVKVLRYEDIVSTPIDEATLRERMGAIKEDDLAYVMFTSGSSGTPKGVAVTHASLTAYLDALFSEMPLSEDSIFANQTPFFTDACEKELYATIYYGATCHIVPQTMFSFPVRLIAFLNERKVNTICWAASALSIVAILDAFSADRPQYLKTVAFSSEELPAPHLRYWMEALPEASFTNLYGPTEGTGVCCFYHVAKIPEEGARIPIGVTFEGVSYSLRPDEEADEDAETPEGELIISGKQIAKGYFGGEEFHGTYATGDHVRLGEDGLLYYRGRKDRQFKRMGYRIEPAEIETCAKGAPGMRGAVLTRDAGNDKLVLCYAGDIEEKELAAYLSKRLPRYMVPEQIIHFNALPQTATGKTDYAETVRAVTEKEGEL